MGQKLSPEQLAIYCHIDEILWKDWDPIGINDLAEARDEYQGYLPNLFRLLMNGETAHTIAEYLYNVVTQRMGLKSSLEAQLPVAEKIHYLRTTL